MRELVSMSYGYMQYARRASFLRNVAENAAQQVREERTKMEKEHTFSKWCLACSEIQDEVANGDIDFHQSCFDCLDDDCHLL